MPQALTKRSAGALSKYDPQKGVKRIAGADAAVKHYAAAKDATNLDRASVGFLGVSTARLRRITSCSDPSRKRGGGIRPIS